jgi:hypothetical protein
VAGRGRGGCHSVVALCVDSSGGGGGELEKKGVSVEVGVLSVWRGGDTLGFSPVSPLHRLCLWVCFPGY